MTRMNALTQLCLDFGRRRWEHVLGAAYLFLLAIPLAAQTVRPLIDENVVKAPGKQASGRVEYVNDSLEDLVVTMNLQSYTVSDTGELSYRPLDSDIHVKLSTMSFRIPAKQNYYVYYEASADKLPSWFVVYGTFSGFKARTQAGFKIQVTLPHTVYLLSKYHVQKDELILRKAEYHPNLKKIVVRVDNIGPSFGRVLEADASSGKGKMEQGGFPLFPHSERQVEIPWENSEDPDKLVLHLETFKVEQKIRNVAQ